MDIFCPTLQNSVDTIASATLVRSRGDHIAEVMKPMFLSSAFIDHGFEQVGHGSPSNRTPIIFCLTPDSAIFNKADLPM